VNVRCHAPRQSETADNGAPVGFLRQEFKRFRESRRSFATANLPEDKVEASGSSRMDPRHADLDKMLDPE
jgi:hypothetical protein